MIKIASWNVNSVKARLPGVLAWAREAAPDILLLQELKCENNAFPALEFGDSCAMKASMVLTKVVHRTATSYG